MTAWWGGRHVVVVLARSRMLSIGKLVAGQERYYEQQVALGRDDYYAGRGEAEGRWMGAGARALGLGGEVDADAFGALIAGTDPTSGEALRVGSGRDRVCALDLTFSAPKSVSVLFAIGDGETSRALVDAHEEAVGAAVGYLEREACRVRRGRGGRIELAADGFVAAAYRHRMSRAGQPQLHTFLELDELADLLDTASALDGGESATTARVRELNASGKRPPQIAEELAIAVSTVYYHLGKPARRVGGARRAVVAGLGYAGLRISELCALERRSAAACGAA